MHGCYQSICDLRQPHLNHWHMKPTNQTSISSARQSWLSCDCNTTQNNFSHTIIHPSAGWPEDWSFNACVICNNIRVQIKARFCLNKNLNIEVSATDNRSIQITRIVCHNREIGHGSYCEDEALYSDTSRSPIYTHNHTLMALAEAAMPTLSSGAIQCFPSKVPHASWVFPCSVYRLRYSHIHLQTHKTAIGSNQGFSILPKGTLTCT